MSAGLGLAEASGVPAVLLHNDPGGCRVAVAVDNCGAVQALFEQMAALGHRHIAFVAGPFAASDSRVGGPGQHRGSVDITLGASVQDRHQSTYSCLGATIVVAGGALLHSTVLPDAPVLSLFLSLGAGTVATITAALLGRGPF